MNIREYFRFNPVIWVLIYSDFLIIAATGFLSPILAVYLTDQIRGGSLTVVGIATAIYWIVKSVLQVPVSLYVDRSRSNLTAYSVMVVGSFVSSVVPLLYFFFAREVWHVYMIQAMAGVADAFMVPTWLALFTKHVDRHKEASEWAAYSNASGIGFALAAAIGGTIAERFGFRIIFLLVSACAFVGTLLLFVIRHRLVVGEHRQALARLAKSA
ncbi:MAG: MFS transporter [Patescibacteria group bacterium]|nr:MFS transporter [Patescibacteria group bacterium]